MWEPSMLQYIYPHVTPVRGYILICAIGGLSFRKAKWQKITEEVFMGTASSTSESSASSALRPVQITEDQKGKTD